MEGGWIVAGGGERWGMEEGDGSWVEKGEISGIERGWIGYEEEDGSGLDSREGARCYDTERSMF